MRAGAIVSIALVILSSCMVFDPVQAPPPAPWYMNRVVVGFENSPSANAVYISNKYGLPIVMKNDVLQFAVFRPPAPDTFLASVRREQEVRYAEMDTLACLDGDFCGGGGGGVPPPPDFSVVASPSQLVFQAGSSGTSTITVTGMNGYSGTVSLSVSISPAATNGPTTSLSSTRITLSSSATPGTSTLTVVTTASTPSDVNYDLTLTGSDGFHTHYESVSVVVTSNFGVTANPTSLTRGGNSAGTSMITLTSVGFSGTINLTAIVSPIVSNGPTATLNPTSATLSPGTQSISTLTITTTNTPSNNYNVRVTGSSGPISRSVNVNLYVPFPNDQLYGSQWGPVDLNLPAAWQEETVGTRNRIIAVVDTGVDLVHPDLVANLWTGANGGHGWDCANNDDVPADDHGHGTWVAGVVAAIINNGAGVAGTAQEWIMPVKSLDSTGHGTSTTVACGIQWAVDHGANVINVSTGGSAGTDLQDAVRYAWGKGALLVGAVGNQGTGTVDCPACYDEVIAVSALQPGHALAPFSNFGPKVELSAPGFNVFTTRASTTPPLPGQCENQVSYYCAVNGTSFAAPFVSGIAALAWDYQIRQGVGVVSNQNIRDALDAYVVDLGPAGRDDSFGFGEPDALLLLYNMATVHSYRLTARFDCCFMDGPEGAAKVWVHDDTTSTYLINGIPVGNNGIVTYVTTGHVITLTYEGYNVSCFYDGTRNVLLRAISGSGGAPNYFGGSPRQFVFPAINASSEGHYNSVLFC